MNNFRITLDILDGLNPETPCAVSTATGRIMYIAVEEDGDRTEALVGASKLVERCGHTCFHVSTVGEALMSPYYAKRIAARRRQQAAA